MAVWEILAERVWEALSIGFAAITGYMDSINYSVSSLNKVENDSSPNCPRGACIRWTPCIVRGLEVGWISLLAYSIESS